MAKLETILAIPLDTIERLRPFVSKEDTRPRLSGVRFERQAEGVIIAATDGHRLGVITASEAFADRDGVVRLPTRLPKAERPFKNHKRWFVVANFAGEVISLVASVSPKVAAADLAEHLALGLAQAVYPNPLLDVDFPDWRAVIPGKVGKPTASFNPQYLADFVKASGAKSIALTLYGDTPSEPHIVSIGASDFIGVQMPMRADTIDSLPEWIAPAKPARKLRKAA